jgi:hypothetical protein
MKTHMLETAGAEIAYDVRSPLPIDDGRPPLFRAWPSQRVARPGDDLVNRKSTPTLAHVFQLWLPCGT